MGRAIILVMDSFGLGAAPDAARFGDQGADTLRHIAQSCAAGRADRVGLRQGPLQLPNLTRWGLGQAAALVGGAPPPGLEGGVAQEAAYGAAAEQSRGKDTPSGHWEIAGCPVAFDWGYFPPSQAGRSVFPPELIAEWVKACELPGILDGGHASGTVILDQLGEAHLKTGKPICYTSADSVFQIAAHETRFGLERLYKICQAAKRIFDRLQIARVIARPFIGERAGEFQRTEHRRDYTTPPPLPTLLDRLCEAGRTVHGIGKISDIFAGRGVSRVWKGANNDELFSRSLAAWQETCEGDLVFANFVDFDTLFGHRRDIAGYAAALEAFDRRLPELEKTLRPGDLVLVTADHGCDPSWPGSDHTREYVPMLFFGPACPGGTLGLRESFADMGQTLARHLALPPLSHGRSCFS